MTMSPPSLSLASEFHIASFGTRESYSEIHHSKDHCIPPNCRRANYNKEAPARVSRAPGASKVEKIAGGEPAAKPTQDCIAVA